MADKNMQGLAFWQLIQLSVQYRNKFAHIAEREFGMTGGQLHTLCLITPDEPAVMNTLSCKMACDASNITGIVDRLVAHGYVQRQDDPNDRRVKIIALTRSGAKLRRKAMQRLGESPLLDALSLQECEQLHHLLLKIVR